jgi:hypothetical protein
MRCTTEEFLADGADKMISSMAASSTMAFISFTISACGYCVLAIPSALSPAKIFFRLKFSDHLLPGLLPKKHCRSGLRLLYYS